MDYYGPPKWFKEGEGSGNICLSNTKTGGEFEAVLLKDLVNFQLFFGGNEITVEFDNKMVGIVDISG